MCKGALRRLDTVLSPEKLRHNGSALFQHSKCNALIHFPESGFVAVVLKSCVCFRIIQPIIFCMLMRQLQNGAFYSHCKCVLRNDETRFTPYCLCILKAVGRYAAAGIELEKITGLRNTGYFKGLSYCRRHDGNNLLFTSACYELPNAHIASSK